MAEGTGLENRHTGEPGIESSNLSLSVTGSRRQPERCVRRAIGWLMSEFRIRMARLSLVRVWVVSSALAIGVMPRVGAPQSAPSAPPQPPAPTRPALLGVYDARSGDPVPGVVVRDTLGSQAETSAEGIVALTYINAIGPFYLIEIRKIGYKPLHLKIRADSLTDRTELLEALPLGAATALPAVVTTGKYNVSLDEGVWNGFAARCTVTTVTCFKFDELAAHPSGNLVDFIGKASLSLPGCGTTMTRGAPSRRVRAAGDRTIDCVKMRGVGVQAAKLCVPTYYVDGFVRGDRERTLDEIEQSLKPGDVKGIEVYQPGEPVPMRLGGGSGNTGCGSVAIWTK